LITLIVYLIGTINHSLSEAPKEEQIGVKGRMVHTHTATIPGTHGSRRTIVTTEDLSRIKRSSK